MAPPGTVLTPGGRFIMGSIVYNTQPDWNNTVPKKGVYFAKKTVTNQEYDAVMKEGSLNGKFPDFLVGRAPWGRTYVLGQAKEKLDSLMRDYEIMVRVSYGRARGEPTYEEIVMSLRETARNQFILGNPDTREDLFRDIRVGLENGNPAVVGSFQVYGDFCLGLGLDPVVDFYLGVLLFLDQGGENAWTRVWDNWDFCLHRVGPRTLKEGWDHPDQAATGVGLYDAVVYCYLKGIKEKIDWRLPTQAEWEKTARGEPVNIREVMVKKRIRSFERLRRDRYENFFTEIGGRIYTRPDNPDFLSILGEGGPLFGYRIFSTDTGRGSQNNIWCGHDTPAPGDWKAKKPLKGAPERMSGDVLEWTDSVTGYGANMERALRRLHRNYLLCGGWYHGGCDDVEMGGPGCVATANHTSGRPDGRGTAEGGFRVVCSAP